MNKLNAQLPPMSPDAQSAFSRAGFTRRDFLKGSGALVVGFSAAGLFSGELSQLHAQLQGLAADAPAPNLVDSWIAITADGGVTGYTGKCELGQGISIAQMQLIAEELSVPLSRVKLIYSDTSLTPDQGVTSGSQSHPSNFNQANLAQAAATAREALVQLASERLSVPVGQLKADDGLVVSTTDSNKKISYGELLGGKKFNLTVNPKAKRKPASEWKVMGTAAKRPDLPALFTGQFEFVHNVKLPGMLHGRVVRQGRVGASVVAVDESSVRDMPGVVKVVVRQNFVGVVAEKPWQAIQAAAKLKVTWSTPPSLPKQEEVFDFLKRQPVRNTTLVDSKDVEAKLASANKVLTSTYKHPYQMHGAMGSSCAVADVQGDKAIIYSPTQGVWPQRNSVAMILGLKPENIRVIFRRGSGCYGLNGADTVTYDAALLSQAVGKPVRVQLSRQDEMAWENFGYAAVIDQKVGLDAKGDIAAWHHEIWYAAKGNRPGYRYPGNIITGSLLGFDPEPFVARSESPDPTAYTNNSNAVPSYVRGVVNGEAEGTGNIKSEKVELRMVPSPFFTGPLRSPMRLQNTFAHESFMDEIAVSVKADPVAYRLRHLSDERLINVVNAAAKTANWEPRAPHSAAAQSGEVKRGRGFSCVAYEGENGYAAMIAEVEVNQTTGSVAVKRFVIANDSGPISNPDGLRNQIEGGALQGLSRCLGEEVTWDNEKVTSINWRSYHSLPLGIDIPKVEVVLLNRPDKNATGAGETSITLVAGAIGNAIFDATGVRLRQVPFNPERVKAALAARA